MIAPPDLQRRLSAFLDDEMSLHAPDDVVSDVLAAVAHTRRRPAWRIPERWIPMPVTLRLAVVPRAVIYLLILAILLAMLAAGGLVFGSFQRAVSPAPPTGVARNGLIAYSDLGDIWLVDERGEQRQQLTSGPDMDFTGAWSPDGTTLAYWSIVGYDGDPANESQRWSQGTSGKKLALRLISIDDPEPRTLASGLSWTPYNAGNDFDWSPDGRSIVYAHHAREGDGPGRPRLSIVDLDDGQSRLLVHDGLAPSWSPDGKTIAYASTRPNGVFLVPAAGGTPSQLSQVAGDAASGGFHEPQWSNDGKRIAFHAGWGISGDIWVAQADGTGEVAIATGPSVQRWPRWSPTEDRIAFSQDYMPTDGTAQSTHVVLSDPDGGNQVVLDHPPAYFWQKEWSPDGTKIVSFTHDARGGWSGLVVIDASGATPAVVMPVPDYRVDNVGRPAWQPLVP